MTDMLAKRKYTKDVTGKNRNNLIQDEIHRVSPTYNVIIPKHAPYFEESLSVMYNGNTLVKGKDYNVTDLNPTATEESGKAVYVAIILTRENLAGEIYITYQTFGDGDYAVTIVEYINKYLKGDAPVSWDTVLNKPTYFLPSHHTHPTSDLYGTLPFVLAMNEVVVAIENLRAKRNTHLYARIAEVKRDLDARLDRLNNAINFADGLEKNLAKYTSANDAKMALLTETVESYATVPQLDAKSAALKKELIAEINKTKASLLSQIDAGNASSVSSLTEKFNTLKSQVDLCVKLEALNTTLRDYVTQAQLTEKLKTYATKSQMNVINTTLASKVDRTTFESGVSDAAQNAVWENVVNRPFVGAKGGLIPTTHTYGDFVRFLSKSPEEIVGTWIYEVGVFPKAMPEFTSTSSATDSWILSIYYVDDKHYQLSLSLAQAGLQWWGVFSKDIDASTYDTDAKMKALWKASQGNNVAAAQDFRWASITGKPAYTTRWPRFTEVTERPETYPSDWSTLINKPETATRFAKWSEVSEKPATFPSDWNTLVNVPDYGKRWPTFNEVRNKPAYATRWPTYAEITDAPTRTVNTTTSSFTELNEIVDDFIANEVRTDPSVFHVGDLITRVVTNTNKKSGYKKAIFKVEILGEVATGAVFVFLVYGSDQTGTYPDTRYETVKYILINETDNNIDDIV